MSLKSHLSIYLIVLFNIVSTSTPNVFTGGDNKLEGIMYVGGGSSGPPKMSNTLEEDTTK